TPRAVPHGGCTGSAPAAVLHRTPHGRRSGSRPQEGFYCVSAGVRRLSDQEVAAAWDDAESGAQPACVLEGVVERQLDVLCAPKDEHRTADRFELLTGIVTA